jgi:nucleoside phosphorylase
VSVDLFYDSTRRWMAHDGLAVEMSAAALFAVGSGANVPVACVLAVSDTFGPSGARTRIDDKALLAAAETMGVAAVTALSR